MKEREIAINIVPVVCDTNGMILILIRKVL